MASLTLNAAPAARNSPPPRFRDRFFAVDALGQAFAGCQAAASCTQGRRLEVVVERVRAVNLVWHQSPRTALMTPSIMPGRLSPALIRFSLPRCQVVTPRMAPQPIQTHCGTSGTVTLQSGSST